jgi:hypothetical protein
MKVMLEKYGDFHRQTLIAEAEVFKLYLSQGFETAAQTKAMWI